jgi:hypothetical protein
MNQQCEQCMAKRISVENQVFYKSVAAVQQFQVV